MVPRQTKVLELGCIVMERGLGQYTTVFQAKVYAIKACAVENLDRNYRNKSTWYTPNHFKIGFRLPPIPHTTGQI
jgi:hypothetical protein